MNIPDKQIVRFLMNQILHKEKITSQSRLAKKLRYLMYDQKYTITAKRARQIAIDSPDIGLTIYTKKGAKPKKCPSCESRVKKTFAKNLTGKKFLILISCSKCGYKGSNDRWVPKRYVFFKK